MMKQNIIKLIPAVALIVLATSQSYRVQAADAPDTGQNAASGYNGDSWGKPPPGPWGNREQQRQQYQNRQRYNAPDSYGRNYPPPPYYGDRNYRRSGRSMPWENKRGGRGMPWESRRGGHSMPWDNDRGGWMNKNKFGDAWDDMLNAPSDMGEMPGGWTAPSVSVPNPVDVGDEFDNAARDAPDQMRNVYDDNRRSNR